MAPRWPGGGRGGRAGHWAAPQGREERRSRAPHSAAAHRAPGREAGRDARLEAHRGERGGGGDSGGRGPGWPHSGGAAAGPGGGAGAGGHDGAERADAAAGRGGRAVPACADAGPGSLWPRAAGHAPPERHRPGAEAAAQGLHDPARLPARVLRGAVAGRPCRHRHGAGHRHRVGRVLQLPVRARAARRPHRLHRAQGGGPRGGGAAVRGAAGGGAGARARAGPGVPRPEARERAGVRRGLPALQAGRLRPHAAPGHAAAPGRAPHPLHGARALRAAAAARRAAHPAGPGRLGAGRAALLPAHRLLPLGPAAARRRPLLRGLRALARLGPARRPPAALGGPRARRRPAPGRAAGPRAPRPGRRELRARLPGPPLEAAPGRPGGGGGWRGVRGCPGPPAPALHPGAAPLRVSGPSAPPTLTLLPLPCTRRLLLSRPEVAQGPQTFCATCPDPPPLPFTPRLLLSRLEEGLEVPSPACPFPAPRGCSLLGPQPSVPSAKTLLPLPSTHGLLLSRPEVAQRSPDLLCQPP